MADLKISDLSALSGGDLVAADELAIVDDSASETKKITVSNLIANGVTLISDDAIPGAKILFGAGDIATAALADSAVTSAKIGADQVTAAKIADNTIVNLVSELPTSGDYTGQLALDTDDNSLYVYSGSAWLNTKAPGSVNAFTDTTSGIINISTAVSSGTATVTASIDNTASAAQFLAGPVGSGGTVGYRTIDGGDLPTATTTAKGGVIVNGGGLTLSTDTIQINNSVTASSTKHLVTYDANGLVTGGSVIASSDLPVATSSAKGAVIASDGLAVDASGNLSIDNTVTSGTYTKVTVTAKGVVSAGDTLAAADIPDHSAAKLTSGTIGSSLIANDAVTAEKLANESTVKFGGALGSDNVTIFPAGDFKGQLFWDETSLDLYVYTGSAFIPITVLSGNLVNAGTYNANTNLVSSVTTAGSSAGFTAGSALPAPVGANLNHYVVVETSGTGSGAAPAVALAPPDMLLSNGVGTEYRLIDVSNAIAGQTAANISFIASGTIAATDVQAALQEVDTEKLAIAGGTMTGDLNLGTSTNVVFEGSSADDYETTLTVTNPTADRTITFPNVTGTVVTTGDTGSVTSTMIADGAIVNADINASAEIAVSKLANGTARQLLQTASNGSDVEFTSNVDVPGTLDVTSGATFDSTVAVTGLLSANGKLAYPAGTAAAVSLYSGSDTDTGIYSPGSNQFGISTAGTSRIVVDASGNVGIGTTSPTSFGPTLQVAGTDPCLILQDTATAVDFFGTNITSGLVTNWYDDAADWRIGTASGLAGSAYSEKMRIDSSGRLLVGTSTSTTGASSQYAKLQIIGNNSSTADRGAIVNLGHSAGATSIATDELIAQFLFTDNAAGEYGFISCLADGNAGSSDYPGRLVFATTADGASSPTERMRIDSSGRTHIKKSYTAPTGGHDGNLALVVSNSSTADSYAGIGIGAGNNAGSFIHFGDTDDDNVGALNYFHFDDTFQFVTASQARMTIDSSGKVGIGCVPVRDLQLHTSDSSSELMLSNSTTGATAGSGFMIQQDGNDNYIWNKENSFMSFGTNALERMRIDSSGNIEFRNAATAVLKSVDTSGSSSTDYGQFQFKGVRGADNDTQTYMTIDSSGNVGIGTTSPTHQLTVHGATTTSGTIEANRFSVRDNYGNVTGLGNGFCSPAADTLAFATNSTERMRIDSSGRLLVGTSSSIAVNGANCAVQVEGTNSDTSRISVINRGNSDGGGGIQIAKSRGTAPALVQNNDQVGGIFFCAGDGNDFVSQTAKIECFIDGAPSGSDTPGRLTFSTTPDGTDAAVERVRITSTGTLQMGDATTAANGRIVAFISDSGTDNQRGRVILYSKTGTGTTQEVFQIFNGTTEKLRIRADGNIQNANDSYGSLSDEKLKENIVDAGSQWDDFKAVRFRKYNFKEETGHETFTQLGVIAQELELTSPGLVYEDADKDEDGNDLGTTTKSVKSSILTKKGLVALQEAMERIEQLETKVAALEAG